MTLIPAMLEQIGHSPREEPQQRVDWPAVTLQAMRADDIPEGERGLWYVKKYDLTQEHCERICAADSQGRMPSPGPHTYLFRWTDATMQLPNGEVVMHDQEYELQTHLQFALKAKGRVLVSGLGLGCVLRGLLLNGQVESIDVVEKEVEVRYLVEEHLPSDDRFRIHDACIFDFLKERGDEKWDCAWHDIWVEKGEGKKALSALHRDLICDLRRRVKRQGAWALPRLYSQVFRRNGFELI